MKAYEYLRKLIADYDKADKDWNVVDFAERYANQRVIEELEEMSAIQTLKLAASKLDDYIIYQSVITGIIKELKQE